jgi:hypothetical protein
LFHELKIGAGIKHLPAQRAMPKFRFTKWCQN